MADSLLQTHRVLEKVDALHERMMARPWADMSRPSFLANLRRTIEELEGIAADLETLDAAYKADPRPGTPAFAGHAADYATMLTLLKRNLSLEEGKPDIHGAGINVRDRVETPDLYADLEHRVANLLLRTRHAMERGSLHARARGEGTYMGKAAERNVLELLDERERELRELQEKFDAVKAKSFFGLVAEEGVHDLEHEVNQILAEITGHHAMLAEDRRGFREKLEELQDHHRTFEEKVERLQETYENYLAKSMDLLRLLKKERDYARRTLMESGHESAKLRHKYTEQLLGMEKEKRAERLKAREGLEKEVERLRAQLKQKEDLASQLLQMVSDREFKLSATEKKKK